jgi:hypothetical protein
MGLLLWTIYLRIRAPSLRRAEKKAAIYLQATAS